jgi:hypothetical protein
VTGCLSTRCTTFQATSSRQHAFPTLVHSGIACAHLSCQSWNHIPLDSDHALPGQGSLWIPPALDDPYFNVTVVDCHAISGYPGVGLTQLMSLALSISQNRSRDVVNIAAASDYGALQAGILS